MFYYDLCIIVVASLRRHVELWFLCVWTLGPVVECQLWQTQVCEGSCVFGETNPQTPHWCKKLRGVKMPLFLAQLVCKVSGSQPEIPAGSQKSEVFILTFFLRARTFQRSVVKKHRGILLLLQSPASSFCIVCDLWLVVSSSAGSRILMDLQNPTSTQQYGRRPSHLESPWKPVTNPAFRHLSAWQSISWLPTVLPTVAQKRSGVGSVPFSQLWVETVLYIPTLTWPEGPMPKLLLGSLYAWSTTALSAPSHWTLWLLWRLETWQAHFLHLFRARIAQFTVLRFTSLPRVPLTRLPGCTHWDLS